MVTKVDKKISDFLTKHALPEGDLREIEEYAREKQLVQKLPYFFAKSLTAWLADKPETARIALLFDTHEILMRASQQQATYSAKNRYIHSDEWLRCLLEPLKSEKRVIIVLAGREVPTWDQESNCKIPKDRIDAQLVRLLTRAHALDYLQRALRPEGIEDMPLFTSIVDYAQANEDEVHPLLLGLCADVVRTKRSLGENMAPGNFAPSADEIGLPNKLIDRLLTYLEDYDRDAVYALSACRSFDEAIFKYLERECDFTRSHFGYEKLANFSFVRSVSLPGGGKPVYQIHELLRQMLHARRDSKTQQAHRKMQRYYQAKAKKNKYDELSRAEAAYHVNQVKWEDGIHMWTRAFDNALSRGNYALCRALFEVHRDMTVENEYWQGQSFSRQASYLANTKQYDEAVELYRESLRLYTSYISAHPEEAAGHSAGAYNNKGLALLGLAEVMPVLGKVKEARNLCNEAIELYKEALEKIKDPGVLGACNSNLASAYGYLAGLQTAEGRLGAALETYDDAVSTFAGVYESKPGDVSALSNLAASLIEFADFHLRQGETKQAQQTYLRTLSLFKQAPKHIQNDPEALIVEGNVLRRFGELQEQTDKAEAASRAYDQARDAFTQAATILTGAKASGNAMLLRIAAQNLDALANHRMDSLTPSEQAQEFARIAELLKKVRRSEPDDDQVRTMLGAALLQIGRVAFQQDQIDLAISSLNEAIAVLEDSKVSASDRLPTMERFYVHGFLALCHTQRGHTQAAVQQLTASIEIMDQFVKGDPTNSTFLDLKATSLMRLAELLSDSKPAAARDVYQQASLLLVQLQDKSEGADAARRNAEALRNVAALTLQTNSPSSPDQAKSILSLYANATDAYDQAISQVQKQDSVELLIEKVGLLRSLMELQAEFVEDDSGAKTFEKAFQEINEALRIEPQNVSAHFAAGLLTNSAAMILQKGDVPEGSLNLFAYSERYFTAAIEIDPNYQTPAKRLLLDVFLGRSACCATLGNQDQAASYLQAALSTCKELLQQDEYDPDLNEIRDMIESVMN